MRIIKIDDAVLVVVDDKTDNDLAGDVLLPTSGTRKLQIGYKKTRGCWGIFGELLCQQFPISPRIYNR